MSFSSSSAIGRVFALISAALLGGAVGIMFERGNKNNNNNNNNNNNDNHLQKGNYPSYYSNNEKVEISLTSLDSSSPPDHKDDSKEQNNNNNSDPLTSFIEKTISKGLPSEDRVRVFGKFLASLNYERRVPNWVLEYFPNSSEKETNNNSKYNNNNEDGDEESKLVKRDGMKFFADPLVPEIFRVLPDDYIGGNRTQINSHSRGLSRGHLAAAQFHKNSIEEMSQTFNMNANIIPQDMTMNALDWLRLENLTKKLRRRYEKGIWVVTGPVFHSRYVYGDPRSWGWSESRSSTSLKPVHTNNNNSPSITNNSDAKNVHKVVCYELIGKHDVAIPTHLFKVILGEKADGTHEVAAFLMPNEPISTELPLVSYQVPVSEIEQKTGLQFFPNITSIEANMSKPLSTWRGNNMKMKIHNLDALPNICARISCEARTTAMFKSYRNVARLRAAQSVPELQRIFTLLLKEQQKLSSDGKTSAMLDAVVLKEYEERKRELVEEAVSELD